MGNGYVFAADGAFADFPGASAMGGDGLATVAAEADNIRIDDLRFQRR